MMPRRCFMPSAARILHESVSPMLVIVGNPHKKFRVTQRPPVLFAEDLMVAHKIPIMIWTADSLARYYGNDLILR
jgi:hypothetical protein